MSELVRPVGPDDHVTGPRDAPVAIVTYGDYECPFSARGHLVLEEAIAPFGKRVLVVARHFPVSRVHPHALIAAQAAEAAAAQDRFWTMHATLYENQDALELPDLLMYADALRLDVARFRAELENAVYVPKVKADFSSGVRSGVHRTPTFFIDGHRFDRPVEADYLTDAIRDVLRSDESADMRSWAKRKRGAPPGQGGASPR